MRVTLGEVVSFGFMSTWTFELHIADITKFGTSILRLPCLIGQEMVDGRDGLVMIAPMRIPPMQLEDVCCTRGGVGSDAHGYIVVRWQGHPPLVWVDVGVTATP